MRNDLDQVFLAEALKLAEEGLYTTHPNPRVGCLLVKDAAVIGRGYHAKAGEAHAEVLALKEAGVKAQGATAYVTLEPCSFHGRTPACASALIEAGVKRVVAAMTDPHPRNKGNGFDMLEAAGVEVVRDAANDAARALNPGHVSLHERGRPFVRIKLAATLDGRTALNNGDSKWITGSAARQDVQKLRARSSVLITGAGTVLADDPALTIRDASIAPHMPEAWVTRPRPVYVLDTSGRVPKSAKLWANPEARQVLAAGMVHERGIGLRTNEAGRVDLKALLEHCAEAELGEVLFECGPTLAGSVIASGLWDELILYLAPKLMGPGRSLLHSREIDNMVDLVTHEIVSVSQLDNDLRVIVRPGSQTQPANCDRLAV